SHKAGKPAASNIAGSLRVHAGGGANDLGAKPGLSFAGRARSHQAFSSAGRGARVASKPTESRALQERHTHVGTSRRSRKWKTRRPRRGIHGSLIDPPEDC